MEREHEARPQPRILGSVEAAREQAVLPRQRIQRAPDPTYSSSGNRWSARCYGRDRLVLFPGRVRFPDAAGRENAHEKCDSEYQRESLSTHNSQHTNRNGVDSH